MLNTTPTRRVSVGRLEPGDVLLHDGVPFIVDELRRRADGVSVLGWPLQRAGQGRRSTLENIDETGEVLVLPTDQQRIDLKQSLRNAVERAGVSWRQGLDLEPGEVSEAGPWEVDRGVLVLREHGIEWRIDLDAPPAVDPKPTSRRAAAGAGDPEVAE